MLSTKKPDRFFLLLLKGLKMARVGNMHIYFLYCADPITGLSIGNKYNKGIIDRRNFKLNKFFAKSMFAIFKFNFAIFLCFSVVYQFCFLKIKFAFLSSFAICDQFQHDHA